MSHDVVEHSRSCTHEDVWCALVQRRGSRVTPGDPHQRRTAVWLAGGAGAATAALLATLFWLLAFYLGAFEQTGSPDGHAPKNGGGLFLLWAVSVLGGVMAGIGTYQWLRKGTR